MAAKKSSDVLLEVAQILFPAIQERTMETGEIYYIDTRISSNLEVVWSDYQAGILYDETATKTFRDIFDRLLHVENLLKDYISAPDTELRKAYLVVGPRN